MTTYPQEIKKLKYGQKRTVSDFSEAKIAVWDLAGHRRCGSLVSPLATQSAGGGETLRFVSLSAGCGARFDSCADFSACQHSLDTTKRHRAL